LRNPAARIINVAMEGLGREANPSAEVLESLSPLIKRRALIRAALLASTTSALGPAFSFAQGILSGLTPAARGEDGSTFLTDPNWKAAFLNEHQNESLISLSDVIIPATGTPGAKEAQVNCYLDLLLSVQPGEFQPQCVEALAFIDEESQCCSIQSRSTALCP
jgi:Gluconate 2-dehydrogenase subunit 3